METKPKTMTLDELMESRAGLPVQFVVNEFLPNETKEATYNQNLLQLSVPMYSLLKGAIDDRDEDELRRLCKAILVKVFPRVPVVSGLLALPLENPLAGKN